MIKGIDIKSFKGLTDDSRRVKEGYLFAAFPGSKTDGRKFIQDAIRNGAYAIVTPMGVDFVEGFNGKIISDENPRQLFSRMAAAFYDAQPAHVAAVTGTNGKTSVAHFIKQLWLARGRSAASIGTLGVNVGGALRPGSMTTPDPVSLHAELADLASAGVTHLAMEASSHGLDQFRLDGVQVRVAGFTNLTHDHLDYHGDMDSYLRSKTRLFTEVLEQGGTAVLNADSPSCEALRSSIKESGHAVKVIDYGFAASDIRLLEARPAPHGQALKVEIFGQTMDISLPLVGAFQAMNALCALGMACAEDREGLDVYVRALENIQGAPGRLQLVGTTRGAAVYIDYAHTPDALDNILKALRPHTEGRLVCLFGCGGDRDRSKRPVMGRIATALADHVIITDDNPRSEDPASIRREIREGAAGMQEIGGRRDAIRTAVKDLKKGDVLVVAGKGHEQGQVFADHTEEFDDYKEAQSAIGELN